MCLDTYCVHATPLSTSQHCVDCDVPCMGIGEYYMVIDSVWVEADCGLENRWGMVCIGCLEDRLGRTLCHDDFTPAPVNWYDIVCDRSDRMLDRIWNEVPNEDCGDPDRDTPYGELRKHVVNTYLARSDSLCESERNVSV